MEIILEVIEDCNKFIDNFSPKHCIQCKQMLNCQVKLFLGLIKSSLQIYIRLFNIFITYVLYIYSYINAVEMCLTVKLCLFFLKKIYQ